MGYYCRRALLLMNDDVGCADATRDALRHADGVVTAKNARRTAFLVGSIIISIVCDIVTSTRHDTSHQAMALIDARLRAELTFLSRLHAH